MLRKKKGSACVCERRRNKAYIPNSSRCAEHTFDLAAAHLLMFEMSPLVRRNTCNNPDHAGMHGSKILRNRDLDHRTNLGSLRTDAAENSTLAS